MNRITTLAQIEARITKTLARGMATGTQFSRLVRQLKIVSATTGETLEQVAARLR